jgi:hypothetical protein
MTLGSTYRAIVWVVAITRRPRSWLRDRDDLLPRLGQPDDAVARAQENSKTELRLQQLDLPADARLRGVQRLGGGRQMIALPHDLQHVAQLLQLHYDILSLRPGGRRGPG